MANSVDEMQSKKAFFAWLAQRHPELLRAAIRQAKREGAIEPFGFGVGQTETEAEKPAGETEKAWYERLLDTVTETAGKILPVYYQSKAQRELIELNLERAKQGLPPIESTQVAPTIRTQVGIDPAVMNMLVFGGLGLAVFLMAQRKGRR